MKTRAYNRFFWILVSAVLIFSSTNVLAQDAQVFNVRPLDNLLADAQMHSPALKIQQLNVEEIAIKLSLLKKEWSDFFAASATFQAGNVRFIDNLGGSSTPDIVTRENIFVVGGVSVRVPLSAFVTKNDRRDLLRLEMEEEKLRIQEQQLQIRQLIIIHYQELQKALRILEIRSEDISLYDLAAQTAEREYRDGIMTLDVYTSTMNKKSEAEIRLVEAEIEAQLAFAILKELVGAPIQ